MSPASAPKSEGLPLAHARELARPHVAQWPRYVIGIGFVAYGVLVLAALGSGSFELLDAVPLIPVLGLISYRIALRIAERDRDPAMVHFVFAAFWAKMVGTLVRSWVVSALYSNRSDALDYHEWGKSLAPSFRRFDFSPIVSWSGTDFIRTMTGFVYSFTGASKVSGAIFFSFLSFIGLLLIWRAFRRAVPNGLVYRYGLLVLFLPSLLYWPSALGKEAWAVFCLGIGSYGVARVLTRSIPSGVILAALGVGGVTLLRPHVAITMFCGITLAAAIGKSQRPGAKASVLRLVLFGALMIAGVALASSTAEFFGVPSLNQETINATLNEAEGRTSEAGSSFTPVSMSNPANAPIAIVTVLFRPLPVEASSAVSLASSFEGLFIVVLMFMSRKRLLSIPRCMRRQPYVAYCVGIVFTFIYAFSSFSNFGILARQRCQMIPFFLVFLCLPEWSREGVISAEEALSGRDEPPVLPHGDLEAPSPYAGVPQSGAEPGVDGDDPYAGSDGTFDPYERFREDYDGYRPTDG